MKIYYIPSKEFDEVKEKLETAEDTIRKQGQCIDILFYAGIFALVMGLIKGCCS